MHAMKAPGDTYESLKEKLLKWVNSQSAGASAERDEDEIQDCRN